jgi:hypothetical protein
MKASVKEMPVPNYHPDSPEVLALAIGEQDAIHVTERGVTLGAIHRGRPISERDEAPHSKPHGLWYGLGRSWMEWTQAEDFGDGYGHVYRLYLARGGMLVLRTVADLDRFTERYSRPYLKTMRYIDWREVAATYDGMEIAPYQWSRRLELDWYYGWDCASGCIWAPRAVLGVEQLL